MSAFVKFDPWAALASVRRGEDKAKTLAGLATLAGGHLKTENLDNRNFPTITAKPYGNKNQISRGTPAKVAKVAKVEPSLSAVDDALWSDTEEERAAVIEYDGGAIRKWAEALARLDPACPPCDIPSKRWLQFIDDCGRFLDDGWAVCAERLGWGPLDLFGCDRTKPFARIDKAGLLWLLNGQRLLALSADAAGIATASGGYLTFRRRIRKAHGVLAWDLVAAAKQLAD